MTGPGDHSFISNCSAEWLESLYQMWQHEPLSVPKEWQYFFSGYDLADSENRSEDIVNAYNLKLSGVQSLIFRYRSLGHLLACTDPLSPCQLQHPLLDLSAFGLERSDLDTEFPTRRFAKTSATLRKIIATLRETYCREIGVEFMHIQDPDERQWLIDRMESCHNIRIPDEVERLQLLTKLHEANLFEQFLQQRFPAQKRFSLEGGEILLLALDVLVRTAPSAGISDLVMGMPHRGRLNILTHIFGKPYENMFAEFLDAMSTGFIGDGDVKYHKGFSSERELGEGHLHLTLASNPSHLEAVNSVVEGKCRARQDHYEQAYQRVLPVLIHGDAAFAGQGSVMETLAMSQLEGYRTGGTIHIVLNNQIGFTTRSKDARSTMYATDVAKMLSCPIFHVQGEAPEAARHIVMLALEYRQHFSRDVVIELVCYRRHGHNEADEPAFTEPLMYQQIIGRSPVNQLYAAMLAENGIDSARLDMIKQGVSNRLAAAFDTQPQAHVIGFKEAWSGVTREYSDEDVVTGVSQEKLLLLARRMAQLPPDFTAHAKLQTMVQKRFEAVLKEGKLDWGTAEALALASLLDEGVPVRLSGQDCRRGTFSHRHCVLHDIHDDHTFTPLTQVARKDGLFQVWDSPLSEFGVLGFEYGYSLETPDGLTLWEAQFGDFANGAQVIIDQFIASGETKWNRASGLVLLLPHGYEGQGAEHSSARIERFLQMCANNNIIVTNPSTPAQLFHLFRRQIRQSFRKPLIVFTPKSLLRHPECVSTCRELSDDGFQTVIHDPCDPGNIRRILLCSGKIFYDLVEERTQRGTTDTAIIRIEQLYPLSRHDIKKIKEFFPESSRYIWVQEEPENMGAWSFMQPHLEYLLGEVSYAGRKPDCCPAVGSHKLHQEQQKSIVTTVFD